MLKLGSYVSIIPLRSLEYRWIILTKRFVSVIFQPWQTRSLLAGSIYLSESWDEASNAPTALKFCEPEANHNIWGSSAKIKLMETKWVSYFFFALELTHHRPHCPMMLRGAKTRNPDRDKLRPRTCLNSKHPVFLWMYLVGIVHHRSP